MALRYLMGSPRNREATFMAEEFIDRIIRSAERKRIGGLGDMQTRRLEARGDHPLRFKLCPNSGPYGATGHMLSSLLAWNRWRAAGGPGTWAEWWAAETKPAEARAAARDDVDSNGNDAQGTDDAEDEDEAA